MSRLQFDSKNRELKSLVDNASARRKHELLLLLVVFVFLALALASLWSAQRTLNPLKVVGALAVMSIAMTGVHVALSWYARNADPILYPCVACLSALGLVMVARLAPVLFWKQLIWVGLGNLLLIGSTVMLRDLRGLRRYRYTWLILGFVLLALSLILGVNPLGHGARLWLGVAGLYFQPSEFLKIVFIVFLASYLAEKHDLIRASHWTHPWLKFPPLTYLAPLFIAWGVAFLLLMAQQDLGAGTLLFGTALIMLYSTVGQTGYVYVGFALLVAAVLIGYEISPFVTLRVNAWLNPWAASEAGGYQIVQSLISFAAGGLLGTGLGRGFAANYVPVVHTDFVFAAIGEELGLAGATALVCLYVLLLYRGFYIALRAGSLFNRLLGVGLSASIALQAWVIAAGNLKLLPLTGVTLPFVSYGGSSLIASYLAAGLLMHISAHSTFARPLPELEAIKKLVEPALPGRDSELRHG